MPRAKQYAAFAVSNNGVSVLAQGGIRQHPPVEPAPAATRSPMPTTAPAGPPRPTPTLPLASRYFDWACEQLAMPPSAVRLASTAGSRRRCWPADTPCERMETACSHRTKQQRETPRARWRSRARGVGSGTSGSRATPCRRRSQPVREASDHRGLTALTSAAVAESGAPLSCGLVMAQSSAGSTSRCTFWTTRRRPSRTCGSSPTSPSWSWATAATALRTRGAAPGESEKGLPVVTAARGVLRLGPDH